MKCSLSLKISIFFLSCIAGSFVQRAQAAEAAVVAEAVEAAGARAFEEAAARAGIEGGLSAAGADAAELAKSMGLNLEDIGALSGEARFVLIDQLSATLRELKIQVSAKTLLTDEASLTELAKVRTNLGSQLDAIQERGTRFTSEESKAISQIFPELKIRPFQTQGEIGALTRDMGAGFQAAAVDPLTAGVKAAQRTFAEASQDLVGAIQQGITSKIEPAEAFFNGAKEGLGSAQAALEETVQARAAQAKEAVTTINDGAKQASTSGDRAEALEGREGTIAAAKEAEEADQLENQVVRNDARSKYEAAKKQQMETTAKLKTAREELNTAKSELTTNPTSEAQEKVIAAQKAYEDAAALDRGALEEVTSAKAAAEEAGEIGFWVEKGEKTPLIKKYPKTLTRIQKYSNRFKAFLWEQATNGLVMGFVFTIPPYILSLWQDFRNNVKNRDATKEPQKFGDMWIQIPYQLISAGQKVKSGAPLEVEYVYVGLEQDPTLESIKRDDTVNLINDENRAAHFFMPRDDNFDEYATAGIGDPGFPDKMVHINTGRHFFGDGLPVPGQEVVQFLGTPQQWARKNLQFHLDEQASRIYSGAGEYEGSTEISDQFESDKNQPYISSQFPNADGFGSVLNSAIMTFMNGTNFGSEAYKVQGFKALDQQSFQALGGAGDVPESKPYVAYGIYLYQTADTPTIKSVRRKLTNEGNPLADNVVEYVLMTDVENTPGLALQLPKPSGTYNFPTYELNPEARKMLSLYDGTLYRDDGKTETSEYVVSKIIDSFPEVAAQITAMNAFIQEQLQSGPFVIGDKVLEIINQAWQDQGPYVYKVKSNDGVVLDYVVATKGTQVIKLPGAPSNFVSLVTSRIYDNFLIPYDKNAGRSDVSYSVCKLGEDAPPIVVASAACKGATLITSGLKAPLYSLFMDPEVNPNKIKSTDMVSIDEQRWLEDKMGSTSWPMPPPAPVQWALSANGPAAQVDAQGNVTARIVDVLPSDFKETIDKAFTSWKKTHTEMTADEREALSTFAWVEIVPPITVRVTSKEDVDNGNHVYTSPFYPDEYLVFSDDMQGTKNFAQMYDVALPPAYAISLSSGTIYSRERVGQLVGFSQKSLDELLQAAQDEQGTFRPSLLEAIKASQTAYISTRQRQQYGPDTAFGRFKFYLYAEDLKSGQYVYADVSAIKDPLKMTEQQLMDQVTNYYVAIELKEGIQKGDKEGRDLDPNNWIYGKALSAKTIRVVSLTSGALYDRGGAYQGYHKAFADNLAEKNLNIQSGFFNLIMSYLLATWQPEGKPTTMRLQDKILSLLNSFYQQLLSEKAEIEKALDEESKRYQPLSENTIANIEAQSYIDSLLSTSPVRYMKYYDGKYYFISPEQSFLGSIVAPQMYLDYNVGDPGNDNGIGMYYDVTGTPVLLIDGWGLENARAYAGVVVNADGSQVLDVSVDHPAIPVDMMIPLDKVETIKTKLIDAWSAYKTAFDAYKKEPDNNDLLTQTRAAANQVAFAKQEYEAAKVVSTLGLAAGLNVFFNETTNAYFIGVGQARYIDLVAGYQYYNDGTPKLFENPILRNSDITKEGLMFLGRDQHDLLKVQHMTDRVETVSPYSSWYSYDTALDQVKGQNYPRYTLASAANNLDSLYVYNDKTVGNYYVYLKKWDEVDAVFTGTYIADSSFKYSLLRYFRTRTTGQTTRTYIEDPELDPTYIIWDGNPDLNLQQLYYRNYLLPLEPLDETTFTAILNGRTITVKKQTKVYGQHTTAHYITIVDGKSEYDFKYDSSILDPELPTNCTTSDPELMKLNFWKQCTWGINVVADVFGITRLVRSSAPEDLSSIPASDETRVLERAGERKDIVSSMLGLLRYDETHNRYLYRLSESRDSAWQYYQPRWNGWYVDLSTGILYTIVTPRGDFYPLSSLHASQLYMLLDRLEVSVVPIPATDGDPLYKNNGDPVLDETNEPVLTKNGLVYRTQRIVQTDAEGTIVKVLNQALVDSASASKSSQF